MSDCHEISLWVLVFCSCNRTEHPSVQTAIHPKRFMSSRVTRSHLRVDTVDVVTADKKLSLPLPQGGRPILLINFYTINRLLLYHIIAIIQTIKACLLINIKEKQC